MEHDVPGRRGRQHTVEHHAVIVQVGIEGGPETVDERRRPEAGHGTHTRTRTRTIRPQARLHRAQERAQRFASGVARIRGAHQVVDIRVELREEGLGRIYALARMIGRKDPRWSRQHIEGSNGL